MGVLQNEIIYTESWFSSRQPGLGGLPIHLWQSLSDLDVGLQRMDQSLANTPLGGAGYTSKAEKLNKACDNISKLLSFADNFTYDLMELVDEPFYRSVHNDVLECLATIDATKITTGNTLGLTGTTQQTKQGFTQEITNVLGSLNFGDFLGYNSISSGTNQIERQQVDGFVQMFREKYDNFMATNVDKNFNNLTPEEFAKFFVPGEFYVEREVSGWLKFLDMCSDILIIPAIVDACLGYDFITQDHLTQDEQDMRLLGAAITAVVTIVSFGQAWAAAGTAKSLAKMLLVGLISDIVATGAFAASDAMGMPPALSAVLALVVGIATGKVATDLLFKDGVVDVAALEDALRGVGEGGLPKHYGIDLENLEFSKTVQSHTGRPYQESKLTINEIIESALPTVDPRGTGALSWNVEGVFNGSPGYYELIIDPITNTVWHFVFKSY